MKHKKFNKKLSLRKNTVSDLNRDEMNQVYGGVSNPCAYSPNCFISGGCIISGADCSSTVVVANA